MDQRRNARIPQSVTALQGKKKTNYMAIISNLFKRMNVYFIHDEDEQAAVSEYIMFYGCHGVFLLLAVIFLIKVIMF